MITDKILSRLIQELKGFGVNLEGNDLAEKLLKLSLDESYYKGRAEGNTSGKLSLVKELNELFSKKEFELEEHLKDLIKD